MLIFCCNWDVHKANFNYLSLNWIGYNGIIPVEIFQYISHMISESSKKYYKQPNARNRIEYCKNLTPKCFRRDMSVTNRGHNCYGKKQGFMKWPIVIPSFNISVVFKIFDAFNDERHHFYKFFSCLKVKKCRLWAKINIRGQMQIVAK